jgi:transposase-like protein
MAELYFKIKAGYYTGSIAGNPFKFPQNKENKYMLILFLRGFKNSSGKQGLFSKQQIADVIPDFEGKSRQSIDDHEGRFRESGGNLKDYINRKRKVDEEVVEEIKIILKKEPLASKSDIAIRVNKNLGRTDINPSNIEAGLEQISCNAVLPAVKKQLEKGEIHYKEEYLLSEMMKSNSALNGEKFGLGLASDEGGMQLSDPTAIKKLLTPDFPVSKISGTIQIIIFLLVLYFHGVPLSVLGRWSGVHKTTVLRWILGISLALWEHIREMIQANVNCTKAYIDEKWIKTSGKKGRKWHYWFVVIDVATGLPIFEILLATKSEASVNWILSELKRIKSFPSVIITDGLKAYQAAFGKIKEITHILCRFHHQQGVTRWLKENFSDGKDVKELKKKLKKVFQTNDKRTVRRRLKKLKKQASELGIMGWVEQTIKNLPLLIPSVGSTRIPATTNAIERFFRAFNRFYKIRCGFHSVKSAKRQLILFLVVYLFSVADNGKAPVETIFQEAPKTPLYKIFNDPFHALNILRNRPPENIKNVKNIGKMADFLLPECENTQYLCG